MGILSRLLRAIDGINWWTGNIVKFLMIIVVGIIIYEIVARFIFNSPTIWAAELSQMVYGVYFILGGGYILLCRGHVSMDVLYNRLSPKWRAILDLFSSILFFIFCGLLLWKGIESSWTSVLRDERSQSFWGPVLWPIKISIAFGALLILLQGVAKFIRDLFIAFGRQMP